MVNIIYIILPQETSLSNGLLINFGNNGSFSSASSGTSSITFATSFSNTGYAVLTGAQQDQTGAPGQGNVGITGTKEVGSMTLGWNGLAKVKAYYLCIGK